MTLMLALKTIGPALLGLGAVILVWLQAIKTDRLRQQRDEERRKLNTIKEIDKIETDVKTRSDSDLVDRISK